MGRLPVVRIYEYIVTRNETIFRLTYLRFTIMWHSNRICLEVTRILLRFRIADYYFIEWFLQLFISVLSTLSKYIVSVMVKRIRINLRFVYLVPCYKCSQVSWVNDTAYNPTTCIILFHLSVADPTNNL